MQYISNRRILVVDDNPAIHEDFRKTLVDPVGETGDFRGAEAALFEESREHISDGAQAYRIDFASQGREAYDKLRAAFEQGEPYALAFVDVRMPPGWDGVETIAKLWSADPRLQAVICTAFADYSWQEMVDKLGRTDRLLILKKPFDPIEVRQLASALTEKWNATRREATNLEAARAAEMEARAYAASLETVNHALETSRKAAESISSAKSKLFASFAQNVIQPVDSMLDLAAELGPPNKVDDGEWLERIDSLCRDGGLLRRGLQNLLDLSELESGTLLLEPVAFSPRQLVQDVIEEVRWLAAQHTLALEFECAHTVPQVAESDARRIRQILVHLLENAIEHTPSHGFVRIAASMRQMTSWQEPMLCLEVIDSGSGLTRDQECTIFEPFCHEAPPRGHFGLGLCVSKRLAQRLGGDLTVESETGAGCRFVLMLKTALRSHTVRPPRDAA